MDLWPKMQWRQIPLKSRLPARLYGVPTVVASLAGIPKFVRNNPSQRAAFMATEFECKLIPLGKAQTSSHRLNR